MTKKKYTFIDLFAGCGGLSEGFMSSGYFSGLAHVEWELPMVQTLRNRLVQKWNETEEDAKKKVILFDIQKTDELISGNWSEESIAQYGENNDNSIQKGLKEIINKESVDFIIGGPPCQAYSIHGRATDKHSMNDDYRNYLFELMLKKHEVLDIYNNLFAPIVKFIEEYKEDLKDYPIEFDASFAIRNFADRFFDFISQQASGSYYGKEQGALRIKENVESVEEDKIESFVHFACIVNDDLSKDKRDNQNSIRQIDSQLKKGHSKQELYDFIYGMDYVMPFFQLKMNGKPLSSLSPGERGALLLLLYLFIDMDDKPLIIDQPEENLDNESVFKYLVHFIKAAKKKRQIIMVTHNPNLAVVCDADQIIQMKIDKLHGNEVTYESGAIENPKINKIIVDILEGTYPAFHNRDCKYFDKSLKIKI